MDQHGYPETDELKKIEEWEIGSSKDIMELFHYIKSLWRYAKLFRITDNSPYEVRISTGGWSGNEDIIRSVQKNKLFWMLCWYQSTRGGYYAFRFSDGSENETDGGAG
jgi:hypothetical protein